MDLDTHLQVMQRLSRSLSRFETQDIKTQLQFNHCLELKVLSLKPAHQRTNRLSLQLTEGVPRLLLENLLQRMR